LLVETQEREENPASIGFWFLAKVLCMCGLSFFSPREREREKSNSASFFFFFYLQFFGNIDKPLFTKMEMEENIKRWLKPNLEAKLIKAIRDSLPFFQEKPKLNEMRKVAVT
jgi:hypothetical protein